MFLGNALGSEATFMLLENKSLRVAKILGFRGVRESWGAKVSLGKQISTYTWGWERWMLMVTPHVGNMCCSLNYSHSVPPMDWWIAVY